MKVVIKMFINAPPKIDESVNDNNLQMKTYLKMDCKNRLGVFKLHFSY